MFLHAYMHIIIILYVCQYLICRKDFGLGIIILSDILSNTVVICILGGIVIMMILLIGNIPCTQNN